MPMTSASRLICGFTRSLWSGQEFLYRSSFNDRQWRRSLELVSTSCGPITITWYPWTFHFLLGAFHQSHLNTHLAPDIRPVVERVTGNVIPVRMKLSEKFYTQASFLSALSAFNKVVHPFRIDNTSHLRKMPSILVVLQERCTFWPLGSWLQRS